MSRKLTAEFIGTLWLVLGGCGAAVLAGSTIGWLGVSFAFGLTVLTAAYALGPVSGCHLNPAVTLGLAAAGRHPKSEIAGYIVAQVLGGIAGAALVYLIAQGQPGWSLAESGLATNGFDDLSPNKFSMVACLITEVVMTAMFLVIILGATASRANGKFAGIAIGLGLTLIHLISIPVTNTSVNPARSTGPAIIVGAAALKQLWLFWVAPIAGALLGAMIHGLMSERTSEAS